MSSAMPNSLPSPQAIYDTIENFAELEPKVIGLSSGNMADAGIVVNFLKVYQGNSATYSSYRREMERFCQWLFRIKRQPILKVDRDAISQYVEFCLNPPAAWVGTKHERRFITSGGVKKPNPKWRPFVATVAKSEFQNGSRPDRSKYKPAQKTIRETFTVLSSFYQLQVLEGRIHVNPVTLIRQKSRYIQQQQAQGQVRRLTERQWSYCLDSAKQLAEQDAKSHERTLFIISALYYMYLRLSELVSSNRWQPQMDHFYQDASNNWWFKTVGKGNKMRDIAVCDEMLAALSRYRNSRNLPPLPHKVDPEPLVTTLRNQQPITSTRQIRRVVQLCFDKAVQKLTENGHDDEASGLQETTAHWLRHTGISDDINKRHRPVSHVRDDAGHANIATTDRYNDIERTRRHDSAKKKAD